MKVLFVDNDGTMRIIAKKTLEEHWPCKVFLAINGAEGVKTALKERPDLLVLDVLMPGLDGVAALRKIREGGCDAPAIFVTAKSEFSVPEEENLNVVGIVIKPFVPRTLLEACSKVLGIPN